MVRSGPFSENAVGRQGVKPTSERDGSGVGSGSRPVHLRRGQVHEPAARSPDDEHPVVLE